MEALFEAKAIIDEETILYNIFRLETEQYKAEMVSKEDAASNPMLPAKLILTKNNETWIADDNTNRDLVSTLGSEIDVFNYGYGDILGRIGVS